MTTGILGIIEGSSLTIGIQRAKHLDKVAASVPKGTSIITGHFGVWGIPNPPRKIQQVFDSVRRTVRRRTANGKFLRNF